MHKKEGRLIAVVSVLIVCVVAVIIGVLYYAHHNNGGVVGTSSSPTSNVQQPTIVHNTSPSTSPCPNNNPPMELNIGGNTVEVCSQPIDGTVAAVSSTSITVKSSNTNVSQAFNITNSTQITHHGANLAASGINVGDVVSLIPTNSNANEAWYILVNPSFQGQ